ncbi:uncharacterized protein LOC143034036 isoform X2 [Oratosquilla oratoria]|uniref:uncharacterized protein LOC143034036 isoform X2 n=1 Tax=Oratosquilla oratoria TaxID=337810 RepID=UPI003F75F93B
MDNATTSGESKNKESSEFLGFSPAREKCDVRHLRHVVSEMKSTPEIQSLSRADVAQANAMARQLHVYKPGIDFVPGARLEVLDARDQKWYQCKVVEVDWGELDIMVHYERWSNRFDEWLKMDSVRIRPLIRSSARKDGKKPHQYRVGDRVTARWVDGKKYQAKISKALPDEQFEVIFYDGVSKVVKMSALGKLEGKSFLPPSHSPSSPPLRKRGRSHDDAFSYSLDTLDSPSSARSSSADSRPSTPDPFGEEGAKESEEADSLASTSTSVASVGLRKSIFDVEIIEQKRKPKRKAVVEELFQRLKKKRKTESRKEMTATTTRSPYHHLSGAPKSLGPKSGRRRLKESRRVEEEESTQGRPPKETSKDVPLQSSESPVPFASSNIMIVDLDDGWKKCGVRRIQGSHAGKWDIHLISPEGKKIRTKLELARCLDEIGSDIDMDKFDFSAKPMRELYEAQLAEKEAKDSTVTAKEPPKEEPAKSKDEEPPLVDKKEEEPTVTQPSTSTSTTATSISTSTAQIIGSLLSVASNLVPSSSPVSISGRQKQLVKKEQIWDKHFGYVAPNEFVVMAEHNDHKCPVADCGKGFRKENLLQMHMKHYHPEMLKKGSSFVPNVADLAYARTVGDHLDLGLSSSTASSTSEKTPKADLPKKASSRLAALSSPEGKSKVFEKKSIAPLSPAKPLKEVKKKETVKQEAHQTPTVNEEVPEEVKEEVEEPGEEPEEEVSSVVGEVAMEEDPEYAPVDTTVPPPPQPHPGKKEKRERRKSRVETKTRKRKSLPSESMSEDDGGEVKAAPKYIYSKRKATGLKISLEALHVESGMSQKKIDEKPESGLEVEEDTGDTWAEGAESVTATEVPAEIINCGCGSSEEEGLMLQCDVCLCWQHGACYNIVNEEQVPDKYICSICDHPHLERSSRKFHHHQDWLKEGRLPRFSFSRTRGDSRLEACIRRGHELTANVLQLSHVLHSLRLKLHIAKEPDHPKFVMWHKSWEDDKLRPGAENNSSGNAVIAPLSDFMSIMTPAGTGMAPGQEIENFSVPNSQVNTTEEESASHGMEIQESSAPTRNDDKGAGKGFDADIKPTDESSASGGDSKVQQDHDIKDKSPSEKPVKDETSSKTSVSATEMDHEDKPSLSKHCQEEMSSERGTDKIVMKPKERKLSEDANTKPSSDSGDESAVKPDVEKLSKPLDDKPTNLVSEKQSKSCDKSVLKPSDEKVSKPTEEKPFVSSDGIPPKTFYEKAAKPDGEKLSECIDEKPKPPKNEDEKLQKCSEKNLSECAEKTELPEEKESKLGESEEAKHPQELDTEHTHKKEYIKEESVCEKGDIDDKSKDSTTVGSEAPKGENELDSKESLETKMTSSSTPKPRKMMIRKTRKSTDRNLKTSLESDSSNDGIKETDCGKDSETQESKDTKENSDKIKPELKSEPDVPEELQTEKGKHKGSQDSTTESTAESEVEDVKPIVRKKSPEQNISSEKCVKDEESDSKPKLKEEEDKKELPEVQEKDKGVEGAPISSSNSSEANQQSHPLAKGEEPLDVLSSHEGLEETDDLALDLGGLGGAVEGGSELAALLSSQSELEHLASQASKALAPLVQPQPVAQRVHAPIIPEAERIEPVNCKLNLLHHVKSMQGRISDRFDEIENQLEVLEAEMGLGGDEEVDEETERDAATLQARALVKLILNDVTTVRRIAQFT